jgi:hypothetical protein
LNADGLPILPELGIESHGASPYSDTYWRPSPAIAQGVPAMDHVMHEPGLRLKAAAGAEALCRVVEPYFERSYEHFCSHRQTPKNKLSPYAAIVKNGNAITFALPLFTAYGKHGSVFIRQLLGNCIDRLLPEPLLRDEGPSHLEATVVKKGKSTVVHLISYCPVRRTEHLDLVEDPFPLDDMPLSVRLPQAPRRAFLAPSGQELPFEHRDGRATVRVTALDGHTMVVFE